ncbi:MAG: hypothetical protein J6V25_11000, partial [Oscillospiraceae bacterium]|nr:hypothetical protein [Oscillospiraceae bacterium]
AYYWDDYGNRYAYEDGKLHGELKIDQYVETGTFLIEYLHLYDVADNHIFYHRDDINYAGDNSAVMPESVLQTQFAVEENPTFDSIPPVLNNITLSVNQITAPGVVSVTLDATDNLSGIDSADITFYCPKTKKELHTYVGAYYWDNSGNRYVYEDGKLHGELTLDQYVETGDFQIKYLFLYDVANNYIYYHRTDNYYGDDFNSVMPDNVLNLTLSVFNTTPDVTTSVNKDTFLHEVTQAQGDAYIVADYSGSTTLSQDVFDAIAGTDKTLDLTSDGITWRFEGSDIINPPKDIELNVTITKVEDEGSDYGESIEENLQGNPGVVMKFAENGQLPGKATIQIKVDYAMREYLGSGKGLSVYYFNNQTQKLELIAQDLIVINDTYVEFPITHCSYYVLTIDLDMPKNRVYLDMHELSYCSSVWIDGKEYAITSDNGDSYVDLPDSNASFLVTYSYHTGNSSDVHTQYPLSMKVWRLHNTNGYYRTSYVPDLDNILQYSGSSIRITGVKGIRMITSVDAGKKSALTGSGLSGYKLLEYGTVLSWASDLEGGNPLVLGQPYAKSNYAYKRNVADPVFQYAGNLIQYTNVLVGFDLDQCKDDIAMRSYMILETPEGGQATVYGGIVYRSIGYIAWQNRTVFIPGTDAYNYVWEIIHHVYGDQYDADYEG